MLLKRCVESTKMNAANPNDTLLSVAELSAQTNAEARMVAAIKILQQVEERIPFCRTIEEIGKIRIYCQTIQTFGEKRKLDQAIGLWAQECGVKCMRRIDEIIMALPKNKR